MIRLKFVSGSGGIKMRLSSTLMNHFCQFHTFSVGEMGDKAWRVSDTSYYSRCTVHQSNNPVPYMDRLISAPVSASKRAIRNATHRISLVFEFFAENMFFSFSFLEEDRWEHVLYEVCIVRYPRLHFSLNGLPFWSWL
jgi:hypothetical protein